MAATRVTRPERKARTRTDLIAAARAVFVRRGFHAASLEEIAEEAGYTKGAVYSNFDGKDDLFLAVLEEHYASRADAYRGFVLSFDTAEDASRAVARFMLEAYAAEPAWWTLLSDFTSHAAKDETLRERLRESRDRFIDAVAELIDALAERHGVSFTLPSREVARASGAFMRGMTLEWLVDPTVDRALFEEMHAAFMRGLERSRQ
jgi:AcrR family transcriptional regulator